MGDRRGLDSYRAKRDFARTGEPDGGEARAAGARFVVQKHAARRLHYDLRLEQDGVLLSWAVPRGPSLRPGERRLAMRTEDHPLAYAEFEGVIPAGEYGGGPVIVWDRGTWRADGDGRAGLAAGKLVFWLDGEKLHGRWRLVRLRGPGPEAWLWMKSRDEAADPARDLTRERPESVLTGRTVEQVREQG